MKVEEQLTSGTFQNESHKLRMNLLYSSYWLQDRIAVFLKPYGITQQQFNLLRILRGHSPDPISTKEIRARMIVSNADTSRLVDRLCAKDLIWKQPCPHDGRLIQAFIGKNGLALLEQIDMKLPALDSEMGNLTDKEAQVLNQLLNKMRYRAD